MRVVGVNLNPLGIVAFCGLIWGKAVEEGSKTGAKAWRTVRYAVDSMYKR